MQNTERNTKATQAAQIFAQELAKYGAVQEDGSILVASGSSFRRKVRNRCVRELGVTWASTGTLYNKALVDAKQANKLVVARGKDDTHESKEIAPSVARGPNTGKSAAAKNVAVAMPVVDADVYSAVQVDAAGNIAQAMSYASRAEAEKKVAARMNKKGNKDTWHAVAGIADVGANFEAALQRSMDDGGIRMLVAQQPAEQAAEQPTEQQEAVTQEA